MLQSVRSTRDRLAPAALGVRRIIATSGLIALLGCTPLAPGTAGDNVLDGGFVLQGLTAAQLSASGTSAGDVYTVGADAGGAQGPLVLHYNGDRWRRIDTGLTGGDLWWITTPPVEGQYFMSGDPGLILRYDPANDSFEQYTTPGTEIMFGIWGAALDDLWAVGGEIFGDTTYGVVWHYDGETWSAIDLSQFGLEQPPPLFKVWGRSATEVYAVGQLGTVLRYDGASWSRVETDTQRTLFTVHGNSSMVVATGGSLTGVIEELEGDNFADHANATNLQMNGVFVAEGGSAVAGGIAGAIAKRDDTGAWINQVTGIDTILDFHAVWIDDEDGIWAVGGNLGADLDNGVVAYFGPRAIPTEIAP